MHVGSGPAFRSGLVKVVSVHTPNLARRFWGALEEARGGASQNLKDLWLEHKRNVAIPRLRHGLHLIYCNRGNFDLKLAPLMSFLSLSPSIQMAK